jgi:hypothetical protein
MKHMGSKRWIVGLASFAVLGMLSAVSVQPTLADQIVVCQSCTSAPGGDPNVISNPSLFNMFVEGNKPGTGLTLVNPVLVVVAEYNGVGVPTVSFGGNPSVPLATVGTFGLTANTLAGFHSGSAFTALGLAAGGSFSFVNFSGADVAHGFAAPTSFTLYAFQLNTGLGNTPIHIDTTATNGSFVGGYGCVITPPSGHQCNPNGNVGQTVFTNTGVIIAETVKAPEPGSALLLGLSLAGVGLWMWRKQRHVQG